MGLSNFCTAQDLVYKPKNPAFGGDTFGYQWLLSGADAQNDFQEETDFGAGRDSEIDMFERQLKQQFLNSFTKNLFQQGGQGSQFGENALEPGDYTFENLNVNISPSSQGLAIKILDILTGETSLIIVPYF